MKFVKENLTLVIVGAVVVLMIASVFYPTGKLRGDLQATMGERVNTEASIQRLQSTEIKIPGVDREIKGVPSPAMIAEKQKAVDHMKDQAAKVVEVGAQENKQGRVNAQGLPLFMGQPQRGFLPKITGPAMAFKDTYAGIFPFWFQQLTGQAPGKMSSTPPTDNELRQQYDEMKRIRDAGRPANAPPIAEDPRQRDIWNREQVMARASTLHMYVDAGAFQQRGWLAGDAAPVEQNIFEAIVDSWLQGDIVRAIEQTNKAAFAKNGASNVGGAAIKRLMRINIGNESQTSRLGSFDSIATASTNTNVLGSAGTPGPTTLFYVPLAAATGDGNAAPASAQPNTIDFSRTMTGRASGNEYDVIMMQINVDVDPSWLNQFIDNIYRQNMGYTVLNIRIKSVDPLTRSSMGFVYGETQVIEAEIVVEALLYREWTKHLMPERVRVALGLPAEEPAATPAQ